MLTLNQERNRLIEDNISLVEMIANHMVVKQKIPAMYLEDMTQSGMVGLIQAADRFDSEREIQFKTFAEFRIRGAILDYLRSMDIMPRKYRSLMKEKNQAIQKLRDKLQREPEIKDIAAYFNMEVIDYIEKYENEPEAQYCYLGETIPGYESDFSEILHDKELMSQDAFIAFKENTLILNAVKSVLNEKELKVIEGYYYNNMTMLDIAKKIKVTESRVSQIRSNALKKLRKHFNAYSFSDFL